MIELLASIMLSGPGIGCTYEHPQPVGINEICTGLGPAHPPTGGYRQGIRG
jgi:hypothetical protein